LDQAVSPTDTSIPVSDLGQFPDKEMIEVDGELMAYDGKQPGAGTHALDASGLPEPGNLLNVQRGIDGTVPAADAQAAVVELLTLPCAGDGNGDGQVTVDEILTAVNYALHGCTPAPTPTPDPEQACVVSGGTVSSDLCCLSVGDFPNTCGIGACGCSPARSHEVQIALAVRASASVERALGA
jgi:hypothetical protein